MKPYTIIAETESQRGSPRVTDVMVIYAPTLVVARQRYGAAIAPRRVGTFREVRESTEAEVLLWERIQGTAVQL
jgi:hypothetical protein